MSGLYSAYRLKKRSRAKKLNEKFYRDRLNNKLYKLPTGPKKPQSKAIVLEKIGVEAKQPNSGIRKVCKVQCVQTGNVIFAFVAGDGGLKCIEQNDEVVIQSLGRRGKSVGDRPGIKYEIIKVAGASLDGILRGKVEKPQK